MNPYEKIFSKPLGNPQFPGLEFLGMNVEEIRSLIKTQKRARGYRLPVPIGASQFSVELSGTARIFLGFNFGGVFGSGVISDTFTLTINNEIILQEANTGAFSTTRVIPQDFYYFPRPLSGTDSIEYKFQSSGAGTELLEIWYI